MSMVALKLAYISIRNHAGYRAYGLASYALVTVTPAVLGLYRYEDDLIVPAAVTYVGGLLFGTLALRTILTITPEWVHLLSEDRKRRKRERAT